VESCAGCHVREKLPGTYHRQITWRSPRGSDRKSIGWNGAWSWDNKRIAFSRFRPDASNVLHSDIYLLNADGTVRKLADGSTKRLTFRVQQLPSGADSDLRRQQRRRDPDADHPHGHAGDRAGVVALSPGGMGPCDSRLSPCPARQTLHYAQRDKHHPCWVLGSFVLDFRFVLRQMEPPPFRWGLFGIGASLGVVALVLAVRGQSRPPRGPA
jgi:hypothetical protein